MCNLFYFPLKEAHYFSEEAHLYSSEEAHYSSEEAHLYSSEEAHYSSEEAHYNPTSIKANSLPMLQTAELGSFAPEIKFDKLIGAPEIYYLIIPIITRAPEV